MNKDASDFMLQEYAQIAAAFFSLGNQVNDWLKTYITLIGLPLTLLAAAMRLGGESNGPSFSLGNLPDIVSGLLVVVGFLGLFVALTVVNMRMEMILYARTINVVRRYFGELDGQEAEQHSRPQLRAFLVLPTCDARPPFFELGRALFWQVTAVGFVDALVLGTALHSLLPLTLPASIVAGAIFGVLHIAIYWWGARQRERAWVLRFETDLNPSNI